MLAGNPDVGNMFAAGAINQLGRCRSRSTRALLGGFRLVGRGVEVDHFTSDLWVHGNYAYTGIIQHTPGTPPCGAAAAE